MATAGMGRQSRLCVILVKVGTPVAKKVFEKRVKDLTPTNHNPSPWTVDEFLLANKPKIKLLKLHSHMWSKIFPVQSHKVKLQQWDLALLCTILTECCDLRPDIRLDICQLRKSRNNFFHMSEPSIDDHKYQHYLTKLKVIFDRCLKEINDDAFTTEMNKMFEDLEQGQFSQVDAEEVMKKLQSMQEETNERLYELGQTWTGAIFETKIFIVCGREITTETEHCTVVDTHPKIVVTQRKMSTLNITTAVSFEPKTNSAICENQRKIDMSYLQYLPDAVQKRSMRVSSL
ncbi:uncharacterized protein LOC128554629 [Mercenaria mercenaria]|uniref:uncharacterized protein LOC128554629 n=1 Tax=Mercenaria mercenaria TaxID=6596 RepID=UPI00234EA9F9|nr:uncharacterized protein LOC128554629 [Mercenaria mercenaria]